MSKAPSFFELYRPRRSSVGVVYFITPIDVFEHGDAMLRVVKIGFTRGTARARLTALQTGSPVQLEVFAVEHGSEATERALHHRFADQRSHGEWFKIAGELEQYLLLMRPDLALPAESALG